MVEPWPSNPRSFNFQIGTSGASVVVTLCTDRRCCTAHMTAAEAALLAKKLLHAAEAPGVVSATTEGKAA